jgi:hypothetical protein
MNCKRLAKHLYSLPILRRVAESFYLQALSFLTKNESSRSYGILCSATTDRAVSRTESTVDLPPHQRADFAHSTLMFMCDGLLILTTNVSPSEIVGNYFHAAKEKLCRSANLETAT